MAGPLTFEHDPPRALRRLRAHVRPPEAHRGARPCPVRRDAARLDECRRPFAADRHSPLVLGERDDAPLLGAVTLETLGLMVNPLTREVRLMVRLPMYRALAAARALRP